MESSALLIIGYSAVVTLVWLVVVWLGSCIYHDIQRQRKNPSPPKCPLCGGAGQFPDSSGMFYSKKCHGCDGKGWVR